MGERKTRRKCGGLQQFVQCQGKIQKQAQIILFLECAYYQALDGLKTLTGLRLRPVLAPSEEVVGDYQTIRLSLKGHPVSFLRDRGKRHLAVPALGRATRQRLLDFLAAARGRA